MTLCNSHEDGWRVFLSLEGARYDLPNLICVSCQFAVFLLREMLPSEMAAMCYRTNKFPCYCHRKSG